MWDTAAELNTMMHATSRFLPACAPTAPMTQCLVLSDALAASGLRGLIGLPAPTPEYPPQAVAITGLEGVRGVGTLFGGCGKKPYVEGYRMVITASIASEPDYLGVAGGGAPAEWPAALSLPTLTNHCRNWSERPKPKASSGTSCWAVPVI